MAVATILHGGLGNQLFQYFYSALLVDALRANHLSLVTARLGHYAVGREMELQPLLSGSGIVSVRSDMTALERCRVPKMLRRLTKREIVLRWGAGHALVDGYFQTPSAYERFGKEAVLTQLDCWRSELRRRDLLVTPILPHLTHIRLTDFVAAGCDPRDLAAPVVAAVPANGSIMTDDEATIGELLVDRPPHDRPTLVPTGDLSSWEVLRTMSRFRTISTNGSSLACWAATLSAARLVSANADHAAFCRLLSKPIDDMRV